MSKALINKHTSLRALTVWIRALVRVDGDRLPGHRHRDVLGDVLHAGNVEEVLLGVDLWQRLRRRVPVVKMDDAGVVDPGHDHVAVDHAAVRREAEASPTYTRLHAQHIQ